MNIPSEIIQQYLSTLSHIPFEIIQQYGEIDELLGKGTYGTVYKTVNGFAIKVIKTRDLSGEYPSSSTVLEYSSMNNVSSDYVMPFEDLIVLPDYTYIVMIAGEVLSGTVPFEQIREIFSDMCRGVGDFHAADMSHHDLKPENFIRINGKVVLADFGLAKTQLCVHLPITSLAFSLWWRPPEFLFGSSSGRPGDIWALGVMLLTWHLGYQPFTEPDETGMLSVIFKTLGLPTEANWPGVTSFETYSQFEGSFDLTTNYLEKKVKDTEARDLISRMLTLNPAGRPTIYEVLSHPYLHLSSITVEKYLDPLGCLDNLLIRAFEVKPIKGRVQSDFVYLMTSSWMFEVKTELNLNSQNWSYAITLFNIITANQKYKLTAFQLVAVVCLHIGSMFYSANPIHINDFLYFTNQTYSIKQAFKVFLHINNLLRYNLIISHPHAFAKLEIQNRKEFDLLPKLNEVMDILSITTAVQKYSAYDLGQHGYKISQAIQLETKIPQDQMPIVEILKGNVKIMEKYPNFMLSVINAGLSRAYLEIIEDPLITKPVHLQM